MLAAALLELMPDQEKTLAQLNGIGIPHVTFSRETVGPCGLRVVGGFCVWGGWGDSSVRGGMGRDLSCNLDDMTAEAIAFAMETLLAAGALDVWTTPITMKKSRLGTMLSLLCREEDRQKLVELLFRHTTTIGVREHACRRYTLARTVDTVRTPYGDVRRKTSCGYGVTRTKYEYEDLARIARDHNMPLSEAISALPTVPSKDIE